MNQPLQDFGLVPFFALQCSADELERGRVGRIVAVQRGRLDVTNGRDERSIALAHAWHDLPAERLPTVGDWVVLDEPRSGIERVLERKSLFRRVAAGERSEIQPVAANIDVLFVVTSCNEEFKESRLERYLALAVEAGVEPVVVLTKSDLADDPAAYVERARGVRSGVHVEAINALQRESCGGVLAWITPGTTIALVGSSGVGKSTLLNTLAGTPLAATGGIREDDKKGRHTTSHRQLYRLPGGGLLIDVPGMRELKVADVDTGLAAVFDDIEALAARCRFGDCRHEDEPGCAVRAALERGEIDARRLRSFHKLLRENERNSASLAERRSHDRAFGRHIKQVLTAKHRDRGSKG